MIIMVMITQDYFSGYTCINNLFTPFFYYKKQIHFWDRKIWISILGIKRFKRSVETELMSNKSLIKGARRLYMWP